MGNRQNKKRFSVEMSMTHLGRFFVFAESPEAAKKLVEENCRRVAPSAKSTHSQDVIGWDFPRSQIVKTFGVVVEATKKDTKKRGVIKSSPRKGEKQYRVDLDYTSKGLFFTVAQNADEAREFIEKYGSQTYPQVQCKLPPGEVGWDCPRKIIKKTGTVTELEWD